MKCLENGYNSTSMIFMSMRQTNKLTIPDFNDLKFVVGTNQTLRQLQKNNVKIVYLAEDASHYLSEQIKGECEKNHVPVEMVLSMQELGSICGITRSAVCAAVIIN
jgi:large subunit ribosomal protein L7A